LQLHFAPAQLSIHLRLLALQLGDDVSRFVRLQLGLARLGLLLLAL